MKAIYKHIAFAALALSAVACSQDDDFAPSYLNDPDAVRITAQVGTNDVTGGFTRSNPLGDATAQVRFNSDDQISVTAGTQAPVTYQLGTDGWNPVGENYLKWEANEMNVTAYYPVGKNNASATTFTVPTEYIAEKSIADADYMTYSGTQSKGDDKAINLVMERKMVRIVIDKISFNDQFATGYSVTDIKVHANTTGYADGEPVVGDIEVAAYKHTDNAFYALLAPTTFDADAAFLTVTVSNGTTPHTLTVKGIPATTTGNSYSFALTVGKDVATVSAVSVTDWTSSEVIPSGEAAEVKVTTVIEGTTATITIPKFATAAMVQKSVTEAITAGATVLMIADEPTLAQQTAIATALTGRTGVALVMGGVTAPATAITELTDIDLAYKNGTGENGYVVTADGYIITSQAGLDAWQTVAATDGSTNLTLACDIEYNGSWTIIKSYKGTIDGNGFAIVGLKHTATDVSSFIRNLDRGGVIKHLGMVGGSFSNSGDNSGNWSSAFARINIGIIMGCYNTSSCTSAGDGTRYGAASGIAGYNNGGVIIACYNAGTISANGDYGTGICSGLEGLVSSCYNTGAVSTQSTTGRKACAITANDFGKLITNDCYYTQPSLGYYTANGTATNITEFTGSDWTTPMNTMNAAIEAYNADEANTVKCNYKYIINTDDATKATQPLVIVEVPTAE